MNKVFRKIAIVPIIFIIIMLIFSCNINANENYSTISDNDEYTFTDYSMFGYDNIFCMELMQTVGTGVYKYTSSSKIEYDSKERVICVNGTEKPIDDEERLFYNGLVYILSTVAKADNPNINNMPPEIKSTNRETNANRPKHVSGDDPRQLALWKYLCDYSGNEKITSIFNSIDQGSFNQKVTIDDTNKTFKHIDYDGETIDYKYTASTEAYTLYHNTYANRIGIVGSFEIEILTNQNAQNLLIVRNNTLEGINLTINKKDSLTKENVSGAKFTITLNNISSAEGYSNIGNNTIIIPNVETGCIDDNEGTISLENLKVANPNDAITITIKEENAPEGYKINQENTTVTLEKNDSGVYAVTSGNATFNDNVVSIDILNQPLITLSGNVWQDGQIGEKDAKLPDGLKNDGNGLGGVLVQLYNANGTPVEKNAEGEDITNVKTDINGGYSFGNVEKTNEGYYVVFNYDGINYKETKASGSTGEHSKAIELKRAEFDSRFKTITLGQSIDGTPLTYDYEDNKAKLKVNMDGTNPASNDKNFRMTAKTGIYRDTTSNIDCGLVKKELDLSLGTDVKEATVKINGKETNYTYAQIIDGVLNFQNKSSDANGIVYNLNLYKSDYKYRIGNYLKDGAINNVQNKNDEQNITPGNELEVYVTYNVALKNQTPFYQPTVNEFVYYYDEIYKPYNIKLTDKYKVAIDETNRKITFTTQGDGLKLTDRIDIELTFALNKESNKYKNLLGKSFEVKNAAEITSYSTDIGGLIDRDSEPGNADIELKNGTLNVGKYENDSDETKGLNISVSVDENRARKITGTVWDDGKFNDADGIKEEKETGVNDVIVQLIEIKNIEGNYYEYIWQQTKSGSGFVDKLSTDGDSITRYNDIYDKADGYYEFTDYIPGNYIIRYIYGDGTTYDITSEKYKSSAENVKTYNGQDYKSTVDNNYNKPWYNTAGYESGYSVARDNEARRLEVMAYSATIDKTNGEALERRNKDDLSNTWMCAETSRINVPVDADNKTTESDSTTASYHYTKNNKKVSFDNVNFGLAERPKTNLVLEKHITGLKITPNGTGVQSIVDAKADIGSIVNGTEVSTQGVTEGLATMKSTRGDIGFWQVATDIEELAQGANLEVEYTYVIRNDSEPDYLSPILVNAYEGYETNDDGTRSDKKLEETYGKEEPYKKYLEALKYDTRGKTHEYGTSLGQWYYNKDTRDCVVVSSRIEAEGLEEALNNDLTFDAEKDFKVTENNAKKNMYDTDGNLKKDVEITSVVQNKEASAFLTPKSGDNYTTDTADWNKTITLGKTLSASTGGELGANLPSYIAEVVKYSNAAGRRDMNAEPENLSYVHSDDKRITLDSVTYEKDGEVKEAKSIEEVPEGAKIIRESNQRDEFWGETIIIGKPFGEDKLTPIQIAIITVSSMAVLGVGIILIKKFVLKK